MDMLARSLIAKGAMQHLPQSAPVAVRAARADAPHTSFELKLKHVTAAALRATATTWRGGSTVWGSNTVYCAQLIRLLRTGPAALNEREMSLLINQRKHYRNDPPMQLSPLMQLPPH